MTQQPSVAMIPPPFVLTLLSDLHQFKNVSRGTDLRALDEVAIFRPAVRLGFVAYAFSHCELGDLAENVAPVLIGEGIHFCHIFLKFRQKISLHFPPNECFLRHRQRRARHIRGYITFKIRRCLLCQPFHYLKLISCNANGFIVVHQRLILDGFALQPPRRAWRSRCDGPVLSQGPLFGSG